MRKEFAMSLVCLALASQARAHDPSAASSAASMLPVVVSVAAPVGVISAGAVFTVAAVQVSAAGTVLLLRGASEAVEASVTVAASSAAAVSVAVGTVASVSACSAGWVLSTAGRAIAFIPNEIGRALLYDQRVVW